MNMKKTFLASLCLMTGMAIHAQQADVQPTPQKVTPATQTINLTGSYQLNGMNEANPFAADALKTLLGTSESSKGGLKIYIGEKGDKAVNKYKKFIPAQAEGYFLRISPKEIVLAGYDERGTFYAVQTLRQLMKNGQLPVTDITDWPDISFRGVVEGFYGAPWSHEARLRQLKFYGETMQAAVKAPKFVKDRVSELEKLIDQDYVCEDYGEVQIWTQVKVTVPLRELDALVAVMSMINNNLMIEDYSDIDVNLKTCYGDLIDEKILNADKSHASVSYFVPKDANIADDMAFLRDRQ